MKANVKTAPIEPEMKFKEGLLSLARLFFFAHIWIDSFVKKLNVSLGITRMMLAKLPFQNALNPSCLDIRFTQSLIPVYADYILLSLKSSGIVCNRVLIISKGNVIVLIVAIPIRAIVCLPKNLALLYCMGISIFLFSNVINN